MALSQDLEEDSIASVRRSALQTFGPLHPHRGHAFDRVTRLVADIFQVSEANISLVENEKIWVETSSEAPLRQIPQEVSFCNAILKANGPIVVADALQDERFKNHPHVASPPYVRFYAGVPLRGEDGTILGALSISSSDLREPLTPIELNRLQDFAEIINGELTLRRTAMELAEARSYLERAINFSELVVWQLTPSTDDVVMTGAAEQLWGVDSVHDLRTGLQLIERIIPEDQEEVRADLGEAIAHKAPFHSEFRIHHSVKGLRWIEARGDWVERAGASYLTGVNADITDRKSRQEHANLLMRELHHRMRNLFATVGAIVSLTRQSAEHIDDYYERISYRLDALNRAQNVLLSANFMTGSMHALMREVEAGFPRIRWSGPDLLLPENALVSMALFLNELATNAVKHGAFMSEEGQVEVHWWHETDAEGERKFHLRWSESVASHEVGAPETTRFGTLLMDRSVRNNLGGQIMRHWETGGLICDIILPARWREE